MKEAGMCFSSQATVQTWSRASSGFALKSGNKTSNQWKEATNIFLECSVKHLDRKEQKKSLPSLAKELEIKCVNSPSHYVIYA